MLTKSDFLKFLQCKKYLWLYKNRKDLLPAEIDAALERRFEEGDEIEVYAYKLFRGGESAADEDIRKAIDKTNVLLKKGAKVIFQPTFSNRASGTFCRADIIKSVGGKKFDIYEVKSSTSVKDVHIADVAFQKVCMEDAGLKVRRLYVIRVNNEYVRRGEIEPKKFLKTEDVTAQAQEFLEASGDQIKAAMKTLQLESEPDIRILKQCRSPYECPFIDYCWRDVPDLSIYNAGLSEEKLNALLDKGILNLKDVPEEMITRSKNLWLYRAVTTGRPHVEPEKIAEWLSGLEYPLHFLDYETFFPAIPMFDGFRPYQHMPFQYSLDVLASPDAELEHYEFLAAENADPVPALAESLAGRIGPKGSVLAWNMGFEYGRNEEMSKHVPKRAKFYKSVNARMLDLMEPFASGHYVHQNFGGKASLKKVLPVLVPELSYKTLEIQEGGTASSSWPALISGTLTPKEKQTLTANMLKYCAMDTLAMVRILERLRGLANIKNT